MTIPLISAGAGPDLNKKLRKALPWQPGKSKKRIIHGA